MLLFQRVFPFEGKETQAGERWQGHPSRKGLFHHLVFSRFRNRQAGTGSFPIGKASYTVCAL